MRSSAQAFATAVSVVLAVSGCAHGPAPRGAEGVAAAAEARSRSPIAEPSRDATVRIDGPAATGTWDWVFRASDDGGNLRVEQEEWHLSQHGRAIDGFYDRAVTLLSTDDRLFKCNQQLGYTRFTRVRLAGDIEDRGGRTLVRIREVAFRTQPSPCDDGARILVAYEGEIENTTLTLWLGERKVQQTLHRRDGAGTELAQLVGYEERTRALPEAARSRNPVTGSWEWELKSVDAEGDERIEHESWHLDETDAGITGSYERRVTRLRGDGVYACNGQPSFDTSTRFDVSGHREGDTVTLTENAYHADKSACDNGLRRLDVYQGSVSPGGGELILTWGAGNQILRRKTTSTNVSSN